MGQANWASALQNRGSGKGICDGVCGTGLVGKGAPGGGRGAWGPGPQGELPPARPLCPSPPWVAFSLAMVAPTGMAAVDTVLDAWEAHWVPDAGHGARDPAGEDWVLPRGHWRRLCVRSHVGSA